ncbi:SGNH/GDSL hydrolase family protein [Mucilaginibacter antarcticus]|uniref:SGNH/GDSL hydrolase family protein n=1 Tax=Mucilaginibacter antarcticus TaxID=1855725 RepID=A0ABW5XPN6_9SPHI
MAERCTGSETGCVKYINWINDCNAYLRDKDEKHSIANYEKYYRSILDQAKAQNPDILFVLGETFALPYTTIEANQTPMCRDVIARQNVVKRLVTEYDAILVPYQHVFNKALSKAPEKYWIWDNIHPTYAGHKLMTREWLKQVSKRIKFLKKYS